VYPNRTLCDVLEEMRKCYETRNFAPVLALIEEAQSMGNRMEAALHDKRDITRWNEEWSKVKAKVTKVKQELEQLESRKRAQKA